MRCVVFGATGYLGVRLVPELLSAGHDVRVMARQPAKLDDVPWRRHVDVVEGDVSDGKQVRRALEGQQVLDGSGALAAAFGFRSIRCARGIGRRRRRRPGRAPRIVYVGGIIPDRQQLSDHLASRAEVGRLLQESGVPTAELRAAAIIGAGSASFETLRYRPNDCR